MPRTATLHEKSFHTRRVCRFMLRPKVTKMPGSAIRSCHLCSTLKYPTFRSLGLPLGSGAIESHIRRVVNLRLKGNSIYWREDGGEAILQIRAQVLTNRWDGRLVELRQLRSHDGRMDWRWLPRDMSSQAERATPSTG